MSIRDWLNEPDEDAAKLKRKQQQQAEAEAYLQSKIPELRALAVEFYDLVNEQRRNRGETELNAKSGNITIKKVVPYYQGTRDTPLGVSEVTTERPVGWSVESHFESVILTPQGEILGQRYKRVETDLKTNFFTGKKSQNEFINISWTPVELHLEPLRSGIDWEDDFLMIAHCGGGFGLAGPRYNGPNCEAGKFSTMHKVDTPDSIEEVWTPLEKTLANHLRQNGS